MEWTILADILRIIANIFVIFFIFTSLNRFKFIHQRLDIHSKHCSERGNDSFNRDMGLAWEVFKLKLNLSDDEADSLYENKELYKEWSDFTDKIYQCGKSPKEK